MLCSQILDAISGVYHADNANYFILESQHTLSQFAEKIHTKTPEIQVFFTSSFFSLILICSVLAEIFPTAGIYSLSVKFRPVQGINISVYTPKKRNFSAMFLHVYGDTSQYSQVCILFLTFNSIF